MFNQFKLLLVSVLLCVSGTVHAAFFFFIIPGAGGAKGNACVPSGSQRGDEVNLPDGRKGLVITQYGRSQQCPSAGYPDHAFVDFLVAAETRNSPSTQCVPLGAFEGDEVVLPGYGRVVVTKVHSVDTQCSSVGTGGGSPSKEATVISRQAYKARSTPAASSSPTPPPATAAASVRTSEPAAPNKPQPASDAPLSPIAQKLRELNGLYKDGVITRDEYDAKRKQLLDAL
jgi:hypothetical protein